MKRAVGALSDRIFDVLVVGAGIHGAAAAWAAARQGLSTALIEKGDFGEATSANSLKVIHGGLRYLQHLNIGRMRESIMARSRFLRMAPELVVPRPFLMPTFGQGTRSHAALRIALALNDAISSDRNRGLRPDRKLPEGRMLSRAELFRLLPALDRPEFTGAALWQDGLAENTDRLNFAFVLTAAHAGATCANYVRAEKLVVENGAASGVEAVDALSGTRFPIRARQVINAAGPWMDQLYRDAPRTWVKAYNLVVRRTWFGPYGLALEGASRFDDPDAVVRRGKRNLFFVPWRDGTMIGTQYRFFTDDPDRRDLSAPDIAEFVAEVNALYPALALQNDEVTFVHVGIMPARPGRTVQAQPDKHSEIIDHERTGGPRGLLSIKGVKYTTGLNVGEAAALQAARRLGRTVRPLPDELVGVHRSVSTPERIDAQEILHAVREEAACKLADVVLRRTALGSFSFPGDLALRTCATLMAGELGWSADRVAAEIAEVRRLYYTASA